MSGKGGAGSAAVTTMSGTGMRRRRASVSHGVGGGDAVRVAVRVRPFSSRELHSAAKCVVEMKENQTLLHDPNGSRKPRLFTFDHSYWSFDGFETRPDGNIVKTADKYADQAAVYRDLGQDAVKDAMAGYHAAIFAYGQTGAGKSFTMVGYNGNEGIIPRLTRDLFQHTSRANTNANASADSADNSAGGAGGECVGTEHQVTFSMLEIYNERTTDLLSSSGTELRLRQHPKRGFYVQGLRQVAVSSYDDVRKRMDLGVRNRTTAATTMNETSSRSHMVVTLHVKQIFNNARGESTTKYSDIHLVDLAGSERAEASAAVSDRLKEGAAINQSLSTLGNVISALAERGAGRTDVVVPYRNSALTKLLHNALGGNSKTVMVAAVSPAALNYEETLSTLRYADRAKQIRNKAVVNESPTDKLIRGLREENARLMELLSQGGMTAERAAEIRAEEQLLGREVATLETQWSKQLEAARLEWEQELTQDENLLAIAQQKHIQADAHLSNVNPDPQLSHVLKHVLPEGLTMVARIDVDEETLDANSEVYADVDHILEMTGPSIQQRHCRLERREARVLLTPEPRPADQDDAEVRVNGEVVAAGHTRELQHLDRVMFGPGQAYLYFAEESTRPGTETSVADVQAYDYDYVQMEIASAQGLGEYLRASSTLSMDPAMQRLRQALVAVAPLVTTANAISAELKKGVRFEIVVKTGTAHALNDKSKEVLVQVTDTNTGYVWRWDRPKFINRCELMKMMFNKRQQQQQQQQQHPRRPSNVLHYVNHEGHNFFNSHPVAGTNDTAAAAAAKGACTDGSAPTGSTNAAKKQKRRKASTRKGSTEGQRASEDGSGLSRTVGGYAKPPKAKQRTSSGGSSGGYSKLRASAAATTSSPHATTDSGFSDRFARSSSISAGDEVFSAPTSSNGTRSRDHNVGGGSDGGGGGGGGVNSSISKSKGRRKGKGKGKGKGDSAGGGGGSSGGGAGGVDDVDDDDHTNDPFWDPPEDLFLGSSFVYLQPLAYGVGIDEALPVTDYRGLTVASLDVHVSLCDPSGKPLPDFALVQDPSDFSDRRVDVLVRVHRARDVEWVQQDGTRGAACRYRFYTDAKKRTTREVFRSTTAEFSYSKQFTIRTCSPSFVNYLKTNVLVLELWGKQGDGVAQLKRQHTNGLLTSTTGAITPSANAGSTSSSRHRSPKLEPVPENGSPLSMGRSTGNGGGGGGGEKRGRGRKTVNSLAKTSKGAKEDVGKSQERGTENTGNAGGGHSAMAGGGAGSGETGEDPVARDLERQMDEVVMEAKWLEERRRLQAVIEDLQQEVEFLQIEKGQLEKEMSVIVLQNGRSSSSLQNRDTLHDALDSFTTKHRNLHRRISKALRSSKPDDEREGTAQELQAECDGLEAVANRVTRQMMSALTDLRSNITRVAPSK